MDKYQINQAVQSAKQFAYFQVLKHVVESTDAEFQGYVTAHELDYSELAQLVAPMLSDAFHHAWDLGIDLAKTMSPEVLAQVNTDDEEPAASEPNPLEQLVAELDRAGVDADVSVLNLDEDLCKQLGVGC
jgi:hypothetical protein